MKELINLIAGVLSVSPEDLNEKSGCGTVEQWDSLMQIRIVMEIEEAYGISIPIDELKNIKTIKNFYHYIKG